MITKKKIYIWALVIINDNSRLAGRFSTLPPGSGNKGASGENRREIVGKEVKIYRKPDVYEKNNFFTKKISWHMYHFLKGLRYRRKGRPRDFADLQILCIA